MRFTFLILCLTFFSYQLKAQENKFPFEYGVKYGLLLSELKGTESLKSLRTSFNVGLVSEFRINNRFAIQSELLYARQGSSDRGNLQGSFFENRINLDYFNLPILIKYYLKQGLAVELGPQFGYLIDANYISKQAENSFVRSIDNNLEDFDASLAAGVSYKTDWGFLVGMRYILGLNDINNEFDLESNSLRNATFQLYLGYLMK